MGKLFSELKMMAVLLSALSIITGIIGCGTGGLTGAPATTGGGTTGETTTPPPTSTTTAIAGRVTDGFIAGATVQAYLINANGTRGDAIGASTTTDANGDYSLSLNYTGPVLVESAGGTYTDWATGKTLTLTSSDKLSAVMSDAKDAVTINITPLTHMAALRAQQDMAANKTVIATAIDTANSKIGAYFGGINIIKDAPINPAAVNSSSGVSQTRIDHAMVLAGISQNALTNNLNPFSLAIALAKDASDGVFDGKQGTTQLTVENAAGGGTTNLPTTAATGDLSANINAFQNSATNKSGGAITPSILTSLSSPTNMGVLAISSPLNFTVGAVSSTQINLSWNPSAGAAGYNILRGDSKLKSVTTSSSSDTGLVPNTQYCYAISAYDASGNESSQTNQFCVTTEIAGAPPIPVKLTATATSQSQINLTWTASIGAAGYKIYKAGVLLSAVTTASATDTGLKASNQYCYAVSAYDGAGNESNPSSQLCATTYGPPPAIPTGLIVRATSPTQIDLSWTSSPGASQYKIYRNGALLPISTAATTYSDATVVADTQYSYTVTAIDATGSESDQTSQSIAHTGLTVPSGVKATVNSATQITLEWINSGGALVKGYKVYKDGALLGAVTATSLVEGGLTANTQYCYSIAATSESAGDSAKSSTVCATTQSPPVPAFIDLLVSSPQLNSDNATPVILTAVVRDSDNRAMPGQTVTFKADSGLLTVTNAITGTSGTATAELRTGAPGTGGDPTKRDIIVTATTGSIAVTERNTVTVTVTGTALSISGLASLSLNDSATLTIFLKNSAGAGIAGKTVTVTSLNGNTLSPGPYVTNASGQILVTFTASNPLGGEDTITASAIGATVTFKLTVNAAILAFVSPPPPPAAVTEMPIGTPVPPNEIKVKYTIGGNPQAGVNVGFATTRGTLSSPTAPTGGDGIAKVNVSSSNSGPVLFTASVSGGGPSAQVSAEFVATTASTVTLQASPANIGTNGVGLTTEKSLITATVRDANNNLVKNQTINFTIVNDVSAGSLSPASGITDSSGTASTYFYAGAAPSGLGGVTIKAQEAVSGLSATTTLTVAKKALFITLATGNFVTELPDKVRYKKDYVALVTDAAGNPVAGATVDATVTPIYYKKGYYIYPAGSAVWVPVDTLVPALSTLQYVPACANEDGMLHNPLYDFNGALDIDPISGSKEDQNGNNLLDPGNAASVTSTPTDSNGHSTLSVVYAKDYTHWVNVKLEARASTAGSTASAVAIFNLPGAGADFVDPAISPPGNPSPFGISTTCFVDLTVTPVSATEMSITWQKSATATSYNIYRNGVKIGPTTPPVVTQNSYADTGLTGGTQYCYQIKTVDAAGEKDFTDPLNPVCAYTSAAQPATPTGLNPTPLSPTQIQVSWNSVAGAAGYRLYTVDTATVPYTYGRLRDVVSTSTTHTNLEANKRYCYAISSYDAVGGESAKSAVACVTTDVAVPAKPTGLGATAPSPTRVDLSWDASAVRGYNVYRNRLTISGYAGWVLLGSVPGSATAVSDMTGSFTYPAGEDPPSTKTNYCYMITAWNEVGAESPSSATVCVSTP